MPSPSGYSPIAFSPRTGTVSVDALLADVMWATKQLTFSFPAADAPWGTDWDTGYGPRTSGQEPWSTAYAPLNEDQRAAFTKAVQTWSAVAAVQFTLVDESPTMVGDIRAAFTQSNDRRDAQAWSFFPDTSARAGDVWFNGNSSSARVGWTAGSYEFMAAIHEIGHGLGLKHPWSSYIHMPAELDTIVHTVMSYLGVALDPSSHLTTYPTTPMVQDIASIQALYGPNMQYNTGADTYTFSADNTYMQTIWDAGGTDTVRYQGALDVKIDLRAGFGSQLGAQQFSISGTQVRTLIDNVWIANGVTLENASAGSGNDTLTGNDVGNRLHGGGGNDRLDGAGGLDIAVYADARAALSVNVQGGRPVAVAGGTSGSDTLTGIERLQFADSGLAFDLDGAAGTVAKILGAVFGPAAVGNQGNVALGLQYSDGGMSPAALMALALDFRLGAGFTPAAEVDLLYRNITGTAPSAAVLQEFAGWVTSGAYTTTSLAQFAADLPLNAANINLTGLAQTGLAF